MKLIVGLGNPGRDYANSLHNLGFMCLSHFARTHSIRFDKKQAQARTGSGEVAGIEVIVARPQTYMNRSGQAVSRLVKKFNISLDDLIVIHDDLDLPLGKIRIRQGGSSAGHKGIESIINGLGSQDFPRIRVGIGRPAAGGNSMADREAQIVNWVLSSFNSEERKVIDHVLPQVSEAMVCLLTEGLTAAMNKYNQVNKNE
ncbi:aminoacyl-tRNA hydrolase [Chloroflexota bacterium]